MKKIRLDNLLVQKGLCESRNKAQRLILAGEVLVNENKITKCGTPVKEDSVIRTKNKSKFVSRGGEKLEIAVKNFQIDFNKKTVLDIGISTGGFTDCVLQYGAKSVTGVDVGYGQVAWKIRQNPKVTLYEKCNARNLELKEDIKFDFIVSDVSFISITKLSDTFTKYIKPTGSLIILIKPQFEAGKKLVEKGGIIKNLKTHYDVINKIINNFAICNLFLYNIIPSKILYPKGNIEYLSYFKPVKTNTESRLSFLYNFSKFEDWLSV